MRSPVRKKGSAQVVNVSELIVLGVVIGFKDMSVVEMAKTVLGWKVFEDRNWEQMYEQKYTDNDVGASTSLDGQMLRYPLKVHGVNNTFSCQGG